MLPASLAIVLKVADSVRQLIEGEIEEGMGIAARSSDMAGACAVSSYTLVKALRQLGIAAHLIEGTYWGQGEGRHCWVDVDGWIVDVTATQFKVFDKVHVVAPEAQGESPYTEWHRDGRALRFFVSDTWIRSTQSPLRHRAKLRAIARLAVECATKK